MKKLLIAPVLALALAACATSDTTPEQRQAKIDAAIQVITDFRDAGVIDPIEVSEKTLLAVTLACGTLEILLAGEDNAEEILAVVKPTCELARVMLVEKQKKPDPEPEPEPVALIYNIGSAG